MDALRLRLEGDNLPKDLQGSVWSSPLSQLLPELSESDLGSPPAPVVRPHLETELSQTQLFEPFTQFTMALAQRAPLVLFLDDIEPAKPSHHPHAHFTAST